LRGWNYSSKGIYFLTICTHEKGNVLGENAGEKIILNELGKIVRNQWLWLENRFECLRFDEWIIMPDHVHGIMIMGNNKERMAIGNGRGKKITIGNGWGEKAMMRNGRGEKAMMRNGHDRFVLKGKIKSISELIGAFKTTSSKMIHNLGMNNFRWQKSFYDEIIRDEKALRQIRRYIIENPRNFLKSKRK